MTRVLLERDVAEEAVYDLIRVLYLQALLTDNTYVVRQIEVDPADNIFLEAALEGRADYIVSLDRHLLGQKHYHGVQVVWPRDFLTRLRQFGH